MSNSLYSDSRLYDLVMGRFATGGMLDFYQRQVDSYGGPTLELACGTGRLTVPLAEAGADITGMDISEHMLRTAEVKARERDVQVTFSYGDIRDFNLGRQFKLILVPAQSLSHLHAREEIEACFGCVRRHLAAGGRFVIELFNPSPALLAREVGRRYPVGDYEDELTGERFTLSEEVRYDSASQVKHIRWHFLGDSADKEGVLSFEMRQFFPQEIDALLEYNDFVVERKYGGYGGEEFAGSSPKQLIVCTAR
jgi:SAM-dependent methyltransferase